MMKGRWVVPRIGLLVLLVGLLLVNGNARGQEKKSPSERWEKSIVALEKQLKANPPPRDAIFFAGSSSIVGWDVKKSFPDLPVVKVGFGGSQIADSTYYAPRLFLEHAPRTIVFYAGDNDIALGKSPEQVLADFQEFAKVISGKLPKTKILFLSIKPSISRWRLIEKIRKANSLIQESCKQNSRLIYVDVGTTLLGEDGMPNKEYFLKDGLHLNPEGYARWTKIVTPLLK